MLEVANDWDITWLRTRCWRVKSAQRRGVSNQQSFQVNDLISDHRQAGSQNENAVSAETNVAGQPRQTVQHRNNVAAVQPFKCNFCDFITERQSSLTNRSNIRMCFL